MHDSECVHFLHGMLYVHANLSVYLGVLLKAFSKLLPHVHSLYQISGECFIDLSFVKTQPDLFIC